MFVERDKTTNTPGFGRMNVNRENNGPPKQMKGIFFDGERQRIRGFLAVGGEKSFALTLLFSASKNYEFRKLKYKCRMTKI
jgi:hypothetical protein